MRLFYEINGSIQGATYQPISVRDHSEKPLGAKCLRLGVWESSWNHMERFLVGHLTLQHWTDWVYHWSPPATLLFALDWPWAEAREVRESSLTHSQPHVTGFFAIFLALKITFRWAKLWLRLQKETFWTRKTLCNIFWSQHHIIVATFHLSAIFFEYATEWSKLFQPES